MPRFHCFGNPFESVLAIGGQKLLDPRLLLDLPAQLSWLKHHPPPQMWILNLSFPLPVPGR